MDCPTCGGTGVRYEETGDPMAGTESLGCVDCEGTGTAPDPCACGSREHRMSQESGPGPLCSELRP